MLESTIYIIYILLLMYSLVISSTKCFPFKSFFVVENSQKSHNARSGLYAGMRYEGDAFFKQQILEKHFAACGYGLI